MIVNCFSSDIAEIDTEYKLIGYCDREVWVVPEVDLSFALRGVKGDESDPAESSQYTMYLSYDVPSVDSNDGFPDISPGSIYAKDGVHYIELGFEHSMGFLTMNLYFLVNVVDCSFGYRCDDSGVVYTSDYDVLWNKGSIKGVN